MTYIEATVTPVLAGRQDDYRALAKRMAALIIEAGALQVVDAIGDADVPEGKTTDLWRAVAGDKAGGEAIGLGWIVWPSKQVRDEAWGMLQKDERMKPEPNMPFDGRRMIFGGFTLIADTRAD